MSSEMWKVEATTGREEWSGNYGPMITYRLMANGQEVDLNQKPETDPPKPGDEIFGHLEEGKYRPKLRKDKQDGGSWNDGGGGGKDDLGPVIHRQVALKILAPLICQEGLTPKVKESAQEIEAFIGEAAASSAQQPVTNGASAEPSSGGFDPLEATGLLEAGGISVEGASTIVAYVLQEMTLDEQTAAMDRLGKEATREGAVARLKERTEKALGEPLPEATADSDIPFARPEYAEPFHERLRWLR